MSHNCDTAAWKRIRLQVLERDGHKCHWCGKYGAKMQCDHIVARALGGGDALDNLVTACPECNGLRGQATQRTVNAMRTNPTRLAVWLTPPAARPLEDEPQPDWHTLPDRWIRPR